MGKLGGVQGPAEAVALSFCTVLGLEECELFLRFDAFGELEVQIPRFQAGFREYRPNTFDKILIAELYCGNIDGNPLERQTCVLPFACLPARFAQHPTADLDN